MLDLFLDMIAGWLGPKLPWSCVFATIAALILLVALLVWVAL